MTRPQPVSHRLSGAGIRLRGFTLIELLVSLLLSSIIFVGAYQVISNLVQYQVRAGDRYERDYERALLASMLTQIIERGVGQRSLPNAISKSPLFEGEPDSLQLISRAFERNFDRPGYRIYRLAVADGELRVAYRRYDKQSLRDDMVEIGSGIPLRNIEFEYFADGRWDSRWSLANAVPRLVRIQAETIDGEFVSLVRGMGRR